jgi:hypothetical protein
LIAQEFKIKINNVVRRTLLFITTLSVKKNPHLFNGGFSKFIF